MDLILFRLNFFFIGMPVEKKNDALPFDDFLLTPSDIHPTIWLFEKNKKKETGYVLNFPGAMDNEKNQFKYNDRIIFCNKNKNFAVLFRNVLGVVKDFNRENYLIEEYRFTDKKFNHFTKVFFKKTLALNRERVFLIEPQQIYKAYQHVIKKTKD